LASVVKGAGKAEGGSILAFFQLRKYGVHKVADWRRLIMEAFAAKISVDCGRNELEHLNPAPAR
jgi:hypothetical protein